MPLLLKVKMTTLARTASALVNLNSDDRSKHKAREELHCKDIYLNVSGDIKVLTITGV